MAARGCEAGLPVPSRRARFGLRSLTTRFFLSHALVLLVGILVLWAGFFALVAGSRAQELPVIEPLPVLAGEASLLRQEGQSPAAIRDLLLAQLTGESARIAILDERGRLLVDSEPNLPALPWARMAGVNDARVQDLGGYVRDANGRRWWYNVAQSRGPGPATTVIASRSGPYLGRTVLALLQPLLLAQVLAIVAAGVGGALLARSLSQPLRRITYAMEEIAQGRKGQTLAIRRQDELGRLSAAFNAMSLAVYQSDRALRQVLSNVTHDLHTPLTAIRGWAELLASQHEPQAKLGRRAGTVILEEALRMEQLIGGMLLLSRLDGAALPLHPASTEVAELLSAATRRSAEPARCVVAAPASLRVQVDPVQFGRVLDNLTANALRYSPPDQPVELGAAATDGGGVALWVADHGPGIPPGEREQVFERFYQGNGSRPSGSAGLGLAIARAIVEQHGGTIGAEANTPSGARLVVRLPARIDSRTTAPHEPIVRAR